MTSNRIWVTREQYMKNGAVMIRLQGYDRTEKKNR
jgi:hypothetical protein